MILTGDVNINMLRPDKSDVKHYIEVLDSLNMKPRQVVTKATRTTKSTMTLIDHVVTNLPKCVTYTEVLPCPLVSDHDAPYITVNARVMRLAPRYKFIRNEKHFSEAAFVEDFSQLPLEVVYALEDSNDQISVLNNLICQCLPCRLQHG